MLLVMDVGNTNTSIGVYRDDISSGHLEAHARFSSSERTPDEAGLMLRILLDSKNLNSDGIDGAILCSVVPRMESVWRGALAEYIGVCPLIVSRGLDLGIRIDIDNPGEVGADRLANAAGASEKYGCPVVVVDLGTAINLDVVSADGAYIGGAIAPGLLSSVGTLFQKTAKLPQVPLEVPGKVIGRNTINAIQSGIIYGYTGLVDALVEGVFAELGVRTKVIATGGHAEILASESRTITGVDPWLTLDGLRAIYRRNAGGENG